MKAQMTLLQQLKNDQLQARKDKVHVKASVLTTLIGEAAMIGKNDGNRESTDEEVIKVIKKFINNAEITLNQLGKVQHDLVDSRYAEITREISILSEYLPKQMNTEELEAKIESLIRTSTTTTPLLGDIMKRLKADCAGLYDGKVAKEIIESKLKG